jgi:hypothetical protein
MQEKIRNEYGGIFFSLTLWCLKQGVGVLGFGVCGALLTFPLFFVVLFLTSVFGLTSLFSDHDKYLGTTNECLN